MPIIFPPVEHATPEGLIAVGGNLELETLITAYSQGIFPWPISQDSPMTWFCPDPRGVITTEHFHYPKSFIKFLKKSKLKVQFNNDFQSVISACANTERPHEVGTWIASDIIQSFTRLFEQELAYSVEVYNGARLVGGLYGVCLGQYITGESMFHIETGASKLALSSIVYLLKQHNIPLLDTQMVTPIVRSFGGEEISRAHFLEKIKALTKLPGRRDDIFTLQELATSQLIPQNNTP